MSRFVVGEIAIYMDVRHPPAGIEPNPYFPLHQGDEVEVVKVGPFLPGALTLDGLGINRDPWSAYEVTPGGVKTWFVRDEDLRKRRLPGAEVVNGFLQKMPTLKGETV